MGLLCISKAPTMGHVGDGNLHTNIYVDPTAKHVENYGWVNQWG